MANKKHINWTFTHNNYANTDLEDNLECRFIAYSKEIAPTTGTPHLQGYVCFKNAISFNSIKKKMPGCHLEAMLGSIAQNDDYIAKMSNPVERGEKPMSNSNKGRAEQLRWKRSLDLAKEGKIEEIDADIQLRYYQTLKKIRSDNLPKPRPLESMRHLWIWSNESGTGKSHAVNQAYPDMYRKTPDEIYWNGYEDQKVVYIEDIDVFHKKIGYHMKIWADKWPFAAAFKNQAARDIRPERLIVTSNYRIDQIWDDPITVSCLERRFTQIQKITGQDIII